jgi:acyl-CoA thioesterase
VHEFDRDTAVTPVAAGRWAAWITDGWHIGDNPNGGYLLAVAVRAMGEAIRASADHPHPLTVTGHFLRPGEPGPAHTEVEVVRTGRKLSTATAALVQAGKERLRVVGTFGDLGDASGPTVIVGAPTSMAAPEDCPDRLPDPMQAMSILHRIDTRLDPTTGWMRGEPTGVAVTEGWLRFADGREPDVWSLPFFADAMPPSVFEIMRERMWVPTIELTVHVRAVPAPGWLRISHRSRFVVDGFFEEDGEIWDSTGRLVAMSRPLGMFFRP